MTMTHVSLVKHTGAGMTAHFYANGRRISREVAEDLERDARISGSFDSVWCRTKQVETRFRTVNGISLRVRKSLADFHGVLSE